ncbi:hypothetical protein HDV00_011861 [Rhizophlyctis rosea]|nr:hypothetical protein HDV00_011861 [Rhizophlyctis rosea]
MTTSKSTDSLANTLVADPKTLALVLASRMSARERKHFLTSIEPIITDHPDTPAPVVQLPPDAVMPMKTKLFVFVAVGYLSLHIVILMTIVPLILVSIACCAILYIATVFMTKNDASLDAIASTVKKIDEGCSYINHRKYL